MMLFKRLSVSCIMISLLFSIAFPISSKPNMAMVKSGPGYLLVGDILDELSDIGGDLIGEAGRETNAAIGRLGQEARLIVQIAEMALDRQRKLLFKDLNPLLQNALNEISEFVYALRDLKDEARSLQEITYIDLSDLQDNFRLLSKADPFFVTSIKGAAFYDTRPAKITIKGKGFGLEDASKRKNLKTTVLFDKKEVPAPNILRSLTGRRSIEVTIPNDWVIFDQTQIKLVDVEFKVSWIEPRWWFLKDKKVKHSLPFKVVILPHQAGTITITEKVTNEKRVLVDNKHFSYSTRMPNRIDNTKAKVTDLKNHIIYNAIRKRGAGYEDKHSGWCRHRLKDEAPNGYYSADFVISPDSTEIELWADCQREALLTWWVYYKIYETKKETNDIKSQPIVVPFGHATDEFPLNEMNEEGNYTVEGELITGHEPKFNNGSDEDKREAKRGVLVENSHRKIGSHYYVSFKVNYQ